MSKEQTKGKKKFFNKSSKGKKDIGNNQISNQLKELFKISQLKEATENKNKFFIANKPIPLLNQNSVDGVDHINFFSTDSTELGSLLSTASRMDFFYSTGDRTKKEDYDKQEDMFASLKCLWAYYRTGCQYDEFKNLPDYKISQLYKIINAYPKQLSIFALLLNGYYHKLLDIPLLAQEFVNNPLPLEYYTVKNGVKKRISVSTLMINGLYEIKHALKFNQKPRLESFLSPEDRYKALGYTPSERYDYINNHLLTKEAFQENFKKQYETLTDEEKQSLVINFNFQPKVKEEVNTTEEVTTVTEQNDVAVTLTDSVESSVDLNTTTEETKEENVELDSIVVDKPIEIITTASVENKDAVETTVSSNEVVLKQTT